MRGVGSTNACGFRPGIRALSKAAGLPIFFAGSQTDTVPVDDDPFHDGSPGITVGSSPGTDLLSTVATRMRSVFPDIALMEGGTNDIGTAAATPAQVVGYWSTYLDNIFAATNKPWFRVVMCLITPRTDSFGPTVAATNPLLPPMVAAKSYASRVTIVDPGTVMTASDIGVDQLHPNDSGYAKLAALYGAALVSVGDAVRRARA